MTVALNTPPVGAPLKPDPPAALEMRSVLKEYPGHPPVRALDDVSVRIDHGELVLSLIHI